MEMMPLSVFTRMASEDLVRKEERLRGGVLARSAVARQRAADRGESFDVDDWAFGTRSGTRFPYGPPYEVR